MESGQIDASHELVELVRRIEDRDVAAENEFANRFWRGVYLILYRDCRDPDLAGDLTQDTLLNALEKIRAGDLQKPASVKSFVTAMAKNKLIAYKRKETNQKTDSIGEHVFELEGDARGLLDSLQDEQIKALVRRSIGELPVARDRDLLFRAYVYGQDKSLICRELSITPAHYDRVSHRARQRLKQLVVFKLGDTGRAYCVFDPLGLLLVLVSTRRGTLSAWRCRVSAENRGDRNSVVGAPRNKGATGTGG